MQRVPKTWVFYKCANTCTRIEMNVTGKESWCENHNLPMCVQVQRSHDVAKSLQQTIYNFTLSFKILPAFYSIWRLNAAFASSSPLNYFSKKCNSLHCFTICLFRTNRALILCPVQSIDFKLSLLFRSGLSTSNFPRISHHCETYDMTHKFPHTWFNNVTTYGTKLIILITAWLKMLTSSFWM
jgi:hypothetical protein